MTIRPGQEWGRPAHGALAVARAASDAELATLVETGGRGPFIVTGGDLYRACGEPRRTKPDLLLAVDALDVILDDTARRVAVAHVVVTRGWWRGPFTAVCNTDSVGEWNLAPRAHPNDGRADVIEVVPEMSLRARWQARRRLPLGTHVPHPQITTRSAREVTLDFGRPVPVRIDGRSAGTARHVAVRVRPDAFDLLV